MGVLKSGNVTFGRKIRTRSICALLVAGVALTLFASTPLAALSDRTDGRNPGAGEDAEIPKAVAEILQAAAAVPPEMEILTILRIVDSGRLRNREAKIDLLHRAFAAARRAQYPLREYRVLITKKEISPPEYILSATMRHGLDRLSLQTRVSKALLDIDPDLGRRMFEEISFSVPRVTCEEILVPEVSIYYTVAAEVVNRAFSARQRARDDHVALVRKILGHVQSSVELAPAASMLAALKMDQGRMLELVNEFVLVLQRLNGDDRSFSTSLPDLDTVLRKKLLPTLPNESNLAGMLLKEYRRYIIRHFTAARCAESVSTESPLWRSESGVVKNFSGEDALTEEDRKPAGIRGSAKLRVAFPHREELVPQMQRLFPLDPSEDKQREAMKTQEWRAEFNGLVRQVADLRPSFGQSESGLSNERLRIVENLLRIAPPSPERDGLLGRYILWLKQSPLQSESWVEWYDAAFCLLGHAEPLDREKTLALFEASGNGTLVLIAAIENTPALHTGGRVSSY